MDINEFYKLTNILHPSITLGQAKDLHLLLDESKDGKVDF
jgi:hypothetical protein